MCLQNFYKVCSKISHTHTHARARCSSSSFIVTLSPIRRTACARAQFSGCMSTTNAHSETGQMAICYQILTLGALGSRSAFSVLFGALFKKFSLFLNTPPLSAGQCILRLFTIRSEKQYSKTRHWSLSSHQTKCHVTLRKTTIFKPRNCLLSAQSPRRMITLSRQPTTTYSYLWNRPP
jgi:hypothetical protein